MKSIILWDDLAFVTSASASLRRVGCRSEVGARWNIKTFRADGLKQMATVENSLLEAADAHLIVISAGLAQTFPSHLREWIERWAVLRHIQDAALAVIGDGIHAGFTRTASPELALLLQRHGVNFIINEGLADRSLATRVVRFRRELTLPQSPELRTFDYAVARDVLRGFGINE